MGFDTMPPAADGAGHEREICCFFGMRLRAPLADLPQLQPTVFRPSGKHPRFTPHPTPCC